MIGAETVGLIKNVVLILVSITGATVAVKGLGTWKRQLKGNFEYELSRRLLVSLYKYRDAINEVRFPAMWNEEMPVPAKEEAEKMNEDRIRYYGRWKAYQNRWDKVTEVKQTLNADLLEAEAIWDKDLDPMFKKAFELERELFICIKNYLDQINPNENAEYERSLEEMRREKRDIIYDDLSETGDEYKQDWAKVIREIEGYLKPKLKHNGV